MAPLNAWFFLIFLAINIVIVKPNLFLDYHLVTKELPRDEAEQYCGTVCDSNLVSIHNEEEHQTLKEYLTGFIDNVTMGIWIGLEFENNITWRWSDNTLFNYGMNTSGNIYPWNVNEPSKQTECVRLLPNSNYSWSNIECEFSFFFVCNTCYPTYYRHFLPSTISKWKESNTFCQNHCGSYLATINDDFDYIYTKKQLFGINGNVWIGLNADANYSNWTWIGNSNATYEFTNEFYSDEYPWTGSEPDLDGQCVQMVSGNVWLWEGVSCDIQMNRFLCEHCDGHIQKYHSIPLGVEHTYTSAQTICNTTFGTTLVSIHNQRDMDEVVNLCSSFSERGCWLGLADVIDEEIFLWDDGTLFDYGNNISGGIYPWIADEPDNFLGLGGDCVGLNAFVDYGWNDVKCDATQKYDVICNKPSELCSGSWDVISGDWDFNNCHHIQSTHSIVILNNTQWVNTNGVLLIEYMYYIASGNGRSGILIYNFEDTLCNYYYIGIRISSSQSSVFLFKVYNGERQQLSINTDCFYFEYNRYYRLKIKIINTVEFEIYIDDQLCIFINDSTKNKLNHYLSGYIGLKNENTNTYSKYIYVSGVSQRRITTNLIKDTVSECQTLTPTFDPTVDPTTNPTIDPTKNPTIDPTIEPTQIPTINPTIDPTADPTTEPTVNPTKQPTDPTLSPTLNPTAAPNSEEAVSDASSTLTATINDTIFTTELDEGKSFLQFVIIAGSIIFCCVFIFIFWCVWKIKVIKKQNKNEKSGANYVETATTSPLSKSTSDDQLYHSNNKNKSLKAVNIIPTSSQSSLNVTPTGLNDIELQITKTYQSKTIGGDMVIDGDSSDDEQLIGDTPKAKSKSTPYAMNHLSLKGLILDNSNQSITPNGVTQQGENYQE